MNFATLLTGPVLALALQVTPRPDVDDPRIVVATYEEGSAIFLTTAPGTAVNVLLDVNETITRVTSSDAQAFAVAVAESRDNLVLTPLAENAIAMIEVETAERDYRFEVVSAPGLAAMPQVRIVLPDTERDAVEQVPNAGAVSWGYRLKGDREVRPLSVRDDGATTFISFAEGQDLPAVFAIGPSGKEEMVNGYMRESLFVIDRVHEKLVFRIDKEKATASRQARDR